MILALAFSAHAESWCASPLVAHEWGVALLHLDGSIIESPPLPSYYGRQSAPTPIPGAVPVRGLPADSGIRTLPVMQLYAPPAWGEPIPFGLEVGFTTGAAQSWWPPVDALVPAADAQSDAAYDGRAKILAARLAREPYATPAGGLGPDPTRQLVWDRLDLTTAPQNPLAEPEQDWVKTLRNVPGALYVGHGSVSERFVFYDAAVHEKPAITLESDGRGYVIRNESKYAVHDIIVRQGRSGQTIDELGPGASVRAEFHEVDPAKLVDWLRVRWTDAEEPAPDGEFSWGGSCVTMRDPAKPVEVATSHALYADEVEALLSVWGEQLRAVDGPRIVYREDIKAIDAAIPLSLYTDMYHDIELRRLSVVLVD